MAKETKGLCWGDMNVERDINRRIQGDAEVIDDMREGENVCEGVRIKENGELLWEHGESGDFVSKSGAAIGLKREGRRGRADIFDQKCVAED